MFVLSRQENESITIGDDLVLTVVKIRGKQVALRAEFTGRQMPKEPLDFAMLRDDRRELAPEIMCELVDLRGNKVRLGINAPKTMSVHRKEVYDAIRRAKPDDESEGGTAGAPIPAKPKPSSGSGTAKKLPPEAPA